MNSSLRHLVNVRLGDEEKGTGEAPGTRHENGPLLPTPHDALMQFLKAL